MRIEGKKSRRKLVLRHLPLRAMAHEQHLDQVYRKRTRECCFMVVPLSMRSFRKASTNDTRTSEVCLGPVFILLSIVAKVINTFMGYAVVLGARRIKIEAVISATGKNT